MQKDKPTFLDWLGLNRTPDYSKARWIGGLITVFLILPVLGLLGLTLYQFIEAIAGLDTFQTPESQSAAVRNTGLVLAAIIGVPFVVWRSVVAQKQVDVAEQGQITDRITKAVEGLGAEKTVRRVWRSVTYELDGVTHSAFEGRGEAEPLPPGATNITYAPWEVANRTTPNLEVRIGAIYALERIAQDSDRDHIQIMEILCAYIRENAPASIAAHYRDDPNFRLGLDEFQKPADNLPSAISWTRTLRKPRTDIQTALTVIGRRGRKQIANEEAFAPNGEKTGYQLDLRNTCLQKADLRNANLNKALLEHAVLDGANMQKVRLRKADLVKTRMLGANLQEARMQQANIVQTVLVGANLSKARLQKTNTEAASLQLSNLNQARLQGARLGDARMDSAQLNHARMQNCNLWAARLRNTKFKATRMQGAFLDGALVNSKTLFEGA